MTTISASLLRKDFAAVLKQVAAGQRVTVTRHGKVIAAFVGTGDLEALEEGEFEGMEIVAQEAQRAELVTYTADLIAEMTPPLETTP